MRPAVPWLFALFIGCRQEPAVAVRSETNDLSLGLSLGQRIEAEKKASEGGKRGMLECKLASDCEVVPVECCDCANGGRQQAVSKANAAALKKALSARCKEVVCTMMLSLDPSCSKRPECVDGVCVLVGEKGATPPLKSSPATPHRSK